jgi:hypothetical protein
MNQKKATLSGVWSLTPMPTMVPVRNSYPAATTARNVKTLPPIALQTKKDGFAGITCQSAGAAPVLTCCTIASASTSDVLRFWIKNRLDLLWSGAMIACRLYIVKRNDSDRLCLGMRHIRGRIYWLLAAERGWRLH